jgi:uncharacterized repeat protein (TIGR01451 family)
MRNKYVAITLALLIMSFSSCNGKTDNLRTSTPEFPTATVEKIPASILISEVMVGIQGNNNFDFVELCNPGDDPLDLNGYSLWFLLSDDQEEIIIAEWHETTYIPPHGHYFLARDGEDFGLQPDRLFDLNLVTDKGGFAIRNPNNEIIDSFSWGKGPSIYAESKPSEPLPNGISLERLPGGEEGNTIDTNHNESDFYRSDSPSPQNTGSPPTPKIKGQLEINLETSTSVNPGEEFTYTITIENKTGISAEGVIVEINIPKALSISSYPADTTLIDNTIRWEIGNLQSDTSSQSVIAVTAPWTYLDLLAHSYFVQSKNLPATFGAPIATSVEKGAIPIQIAKSLVGESITIEGIATMYTGGYYAGSGNTKFYIEDETSGMQVWVDDGDGIIEVPLGAHVRVQGELLVYRGAYELAPKLDGVDILSSPTEGTLWPPTLVSIGEAANNKDSLPGMLIQVEGTVARVEEFTYSYEIDLIDEQGQLLTLYVDKQTNISVELIQSGQDLQATGILEIRDNINQLYPRIQTDLQEIFPPILIIESSAPANVEVGETFDITFTVTNHTHDTIKDVMIETSFSQSDFDNYLEIISVQDDEEVHFIESPSDDNGIIYYTWQVDQLPGKGGEVSANISVRLTGDLDSFIFVGYAYADTYIPENIEEPPMTLIETFIGDTIPISAIQGFGYSSPYLLETVSTTGVVTGVFPELAGFFIQSTTPDDDPYTSEGIFINTSGIASAVDLNTGDYVSVTGLVREAYQQTQLFIDSLEDLEVVSQYQPIPPAIELDPPVSSTESVEYYEALEGMLVQVTGPTIAVAPTNPYGEYSLVLKYHNKTRLFRGQENGMIIMVDDGSTMRHDDSSTLQYVVRSRDEVRDLYGPLAYTYGNYKIEPIHPPQIVTGTSELPNIEPPGLLEFSIMTWNVENLFDFTDPHPSSPPMPTLKEYKLSIAKVANTILSAGTPTIIGLQEVENVDVLEDIAEHQSLVEFQYHPLLIEGDDSRGIDVGYLVRGDVVEVLDTQQYPAPEGITSRHPLVIEMKVTLEDQSALLFVINNHFTSMSGGETATEPRRTAQAAWNAALYQEIIAEYSDANVAIIGDLNSFFDSLPIQTLRDSGLLHSFDLLLPEERYTYIYQGVSQTLDHILLSPSLFNIASRVEVLHTNADFPPPSPDDESPQRKSDHDPVIVTFSLEP